MFPSDDDPPTERPVPDRFPSSAHGHDPQGEAERQDNLVLLAVGEPVAPEFARHQAGCAQCQRDLDAFIETVRLGREAGVRRDYADATPPASIWAGITAELSAELGSLPTAEPAAIPRGAGVGSRSAAEPRSASPSGPWAAFPTEPAARSATWLGARRRRPAARPPGRTRLGLVAAGIVLAAVAAGGGYLAGHSASVTSAHVASSARLTTVSGGPEHVVGTAAVRPGADGRQVVVSTTGLPLRNGFYEVWLFDPDRGSGGDMVAVGTLGDTGRGTFTLPGGIDIRAYHVVDVSAQSYGGGSKIVHAQSVLRGSLTQ